MKAGLLKRCKDARGNLWRPDLQHDPKAKQLRIDLQGAIDVLYDDVPGNPMLESMDGRAIEDLCDRAERYVR